ncbi:MAG TPA: DUF6600 domain-containing protein [Chitinophagaceae bacterium]
MKHLNKFLAIFLLLFIFFTINPKQLKAQDASVNFQIFYDDLSPYGQWIDYPNYGYAWVPNAGADFVPYSTGGHWIWTDYGWTWASDYDWGWAPFHYGRWQDDSYYGWVWIPDNDWAPAWVSWRTSPGYYGWTPLAPGISFNMAIGNYNPPIDRWIFLPERYMGRNDIRTYYQPRQNNQTYFKNSRVINNTYVDNSRHTTYISGPRREDVQRVTGTEIKPFTIRDNSTPGQRINNTELNIYRPHISRGTNDRPLKIADKKEINPRGDNQLRRNNNPGKENNNKPNSNDKSLEPIRQQQQQQQPVQQTQPVQQQPQEQQPIQQTKPVQQRRQPVQQTKPVQQQPQQQQRQHRQQPTQHRQQPTQQVQQPTQQRQPKQQQTPPQQRTQPIQQPRQQIQPQQRIQHVQRPVQQIPQQQKTQPPQQRPVKKDGH